MRGVVILAAPNGSTNAVERVIQLPPQTSPIPHCALPTVEPENFRTPFDMLYGCKRLDSDTIEVCAIEASLLKGDQSPKCEMDRRRLTFRCRFEKSDATAMKTFRFKIRFIFPTTTKLTQNAKRSNPLKCLHT